MKEGLGARRDTNVGRTNVLQVSRMDVVNFAPHEGVNSEMPGLVASMEWALGVQWAHFCQFLFIELNVDGNIYIKN